MTIELAAYGIAVLLTAACVVIHFQTMRRFCGLGAAGAALPGSAGDSMALMMAALLVAHVVEIGLFAIVYHLLAGTSFGYVQAGETFLDYVYFSFSVYTTLGIGDLYPKGPLRALAGIEGLVGLILIAWSASLALLRLQSHAERGE